MWITPDAEKAPKPNKRHSQIESEMCRPELYVSHSILIEIVNKKEDMHKDVNQLRPPNPRRY